MIPNFALSLSFEGISLLRRIGPRWARIDEVALDHDDLDSAVIALRDRAESLDPTGAQVALLIPNEQIRYLDQPDMGGDAATREVAIRAALDGATPYPVTQLKFDHVVSGGRLQIAAVAIETLDEAQTFAREHGFEPVCFIAQAATGAFDGAVFFGKAKGWTRAVSRPPRRIEIVAADDAALTPLPPPEVKPAEPARPAKADAGADTSGRSAGAAPARPTAPTPAAKPAAAASAGAAATDVGTPAAIRSSGTAKAIEGQEALPAEKAPRQPAQPSASGEDPEQDSAFSTPIAFSSTRAPKLTDPAGEGPRMSAPELSRARITPIAPKADADQSSDKTDPAVLKQPTGFFANPSTPALLAKASAAADEAERKAMEKAANARAEKQPTDTTAKVAPPLKGKAPARSKTPAVTAPKTIPPKAPKKPGVKTPPPMAAARAAGLAAAPPPEPKDDDLFAAPAAAGQKNIGQKTAPRPNTLARLAALRTPRAGLPTDGPVPSRAQAAPAKDPKFDPKNERDRMTVFGARGNDRVGGKPPFLGLMLSAVLLLFLAGIAAWASVFLDEGLARIFRGDAPESAVAALPDGDAPTVTETDEAAAPRAADAPIAPQTSARPVARPDTGVQLATFDTAADLPDSAPSPLAVPTTAIPRALTPDEAAATYAATGIWQRAPTEPMTPPADGVEEIYAASIDPEIQMFDAVALPDPQDLAQSAALTDPGLPPPAGLTFDFDDRDLVRATPEGALSPDGLRIFTGRPPVIPPLRDGSASQAPIATDPASIVARVEAMPRIRPEARPDDVIEQRERAQLRGFSLEELGQIRPVMRPRTVQEEAEVLSPDATDEAVRSSLIPVARPRNMAAIVDQADVRPDPEPVQTAAVAPRTIAPNIPSTASVARAATLENAINLNRINLIGIYGTPENRRALVRLANGKYEKVQVGDRLDGGRVSAIGDEELRYRKGSRDVLLKMPRG